jgi:hypothetical protein
LILLYNSVHYVFINQAPKPAADDEEYQPSDDEEEEVEENEVQRRARAKKDKRQKKREKKEKVSKKFKFPNILLNCISIIALNRKLLSSESWKRGRLQSVKN